MAFFVSTTRTADDQLADLWMQANSRGRRAINASALRLDSVLARSADTAGIPYPAGRLPTARRIDDPPLAVVFVLHVSTRTAVILDYLDSSSP